ncbi:MAG: hypothetical protein H6R17_1771 [Proteobacteria bacterium]|nr:hypothetical protein [Pseudomonadota bacterium]
MPNTPVGSLRASLIAVALLFSLSACDMIQQQMGIENPAAKEARADADGKAVGGACRQSGRAIEDCYSIYSWLPKASIYEGWRDMDAYMRDNKLETVEPQLPPVAAPLTPGAKKKAAAAPAAESQAADASKKAVEKH